MHDVSMSEVAIFSYQELLRKLGAWLDAASARAVTLREAQGGFTVRYERQDIDLVFMQRFFSYDELRTLHLGDLRVRRTIVRKIGHKFQGLAGEPGGYQDLFRALGYTLDAQGAHRIHLSEDESEGTLVLRYEPSSQAGAQTSVLGVNERDNLRQAAKARRGETGMLRSRWPWGRTV